MKSSKNPDAESAGVSADVDCDEWLEQSLTRLESRGPVSVARDLLSAMPPTIRHSDSACKKLIVRELIKLDMALSAYQGHVRSLDFYCDDVLACDAVTSDLIFEYLQLARQFGADVDFANLNRRYPKGSCSIGQLIAEGNWMGDRSAKLIRRYRVGEKLDDFEILRFLGSGSFADVYLARQMSIGRLVALKVSSRSEDEIKMLSRLDHPNIVRVFDHRVVSGDSSTTSTMSLIYMQFHPGGTLADVIAWRSAMPESSSRTGQVFLDCIDGRLFDLAQPPPDQSSTRMFLSDASIPSAVAWIGIQIFRSLAHAHQRGVLHRDIKPANVLLTAEGIPKLADFNASQASAADVSVGSVFVGEGTLSRSTSQAGIGGSLAYMSPEHLRAMRKQFDRDSELTGVHVVDHHADIYSTSMLLFELWRGHRPFGNAQPAATTVQAIDEQLELRFRPILLENSITVENADQTFADRLLESILQRALSPDPSDRFKNASAMEGQLRLVLHPNTARLFDPPAGSIARRLLSLPIWLNACVVLLVPNVAAMFTNFHYNRNQVLSDESVRLELDAISWAINLAVMPVVILLAIYYSRSITQSIISVSSGDAPSHERMDDTLDLGHIAAVIGATLWAASGVTIPLLLSLEADGFDRFNAVHMFASSLGCGGFAIIYPYFAMTTLASWVYYPRYLLHTLRDEGFEARRQRIVRRGQYYLTAASLLPMVVAAGMIASEAASATAIIAVLLIGASGLIISNALHHRTLSVWGRLSTWMSVE
ncbi:serine/threonine-protein kinase [Allorhodopirellula heiligendammensis]|uniref:serine/threonine-protein kinase n=1 Tax=Allorhodopirellula heiligendammensis TaxID=2714739 RepID=UPI0026604529|nr:serine/threonine-protein kinase [Allorhodopirellula heiligendammensis]